MARHLMAVCVVCLLCADHLPCKEHLENSNLRTTTKIDSTNVEYPSVLPIHDSVETQKNNENFDSIHLKNVLRSKNLHNKLVDSNSNDFPRRLDNNVHVNDMTNPSARRRSKRHAHHHHNSEDSEFEIMNTPGNKIAQEFLKKIFQRFGNTDGKTMDLIGFEKMLLHLDMYSLVEYRAQKDDKSSIRTTTAAAASASSSSTTASSSLLNSATSNESCISSLDLIDRISPSTAPSSSSSSNTHIVHDHESESHQGHYDEHHANDSDSSRNSSALAANKTTDHSESDIKSRISLSTNDLYNICPILLYQLTGPTVLDQAGCIASDLIPKYTVEPLEGVMEGQSRVYVWLYGSISVAVVSLVGLLGVAVIPCMDRHYYQHIIQFLVALAVGTLAGDAMLHLLPHAMIAINSDDHHASMTYKGLVAVVGIIFFFATERGLTMIAEWRKQIEKKEKPSSRVRVMRDPDSASMNNSTAGDKLCKDRYNSYPYCYNEIAMETKDDHHHHHNHKANRDSIGSGTPLNKKKHSCNSHNNVSNNENNISRDVKEHTADHHHQHDNGQQLLPSIDKEGEREKIRPYQEETYTIILREHESSHHGHSHKHGHVHSPPRSLSAVAWMVVMGDGLHNFTDGMAIGAAFSNSIAGGFSTSIAVFCHELPHELGDFAVLLKAGMTAKQAVYYNLLSSVLSFFGMILGILIGDTPEASAWVFAVAAGLFLYIALVDMMPELTSAHNERCALPQCALQILGMCSGLGIMLLIALFEDDLKSMF